jgi:hypothetical protein
VTVHGTSNADIINVVRGAATSVSVGALKSVLVRNTESLHIASGDGSDSTTISGSGGPSSLIVEGGFASSISQDSITVTTSDAAVFFGADPSSGLLSTAGGIIGFAGVERVNLIGDGTGQLDVVGTDGNDAINQFFNTITVNNAFLVNFSNYPIVHLQGGSGSDTFNLHPGTAVAAGVTSFIVSGTDPTGGSDTLVVNGTEGVFDALVVEGTAAGAGNVTFFTGIAPNVEFSGLERVVLVGQLADGDAMGVDGTLGDDVLEYLPGPTPDTGAIIGTMDENNMTGQGPFPLVPIHFRGMSQAGLLQFNVSGQIGGDDTFIYNGTAANDDVRLAFFSPNQVEITNIASGQLYANLIADNITQAIVRTHGGEDTISVLGSPGLALFIDGGEPSGSDVLNVLGSGGGAITVDLGANTVQEVGGQLVTLSGIGTLNVDAGGQDLTVLATAGNDELRVTPTVANGATVTLAASTPFIGERPVVNGSNVGALNVSLLDGFDHLIVNGSETDDVLIIDGDSVENLGALIVNYAGAVALSVNGLGGDDTFVVTASTVRTFVDGGNPIGVVGDTLELIVPAGAGAVSFQPGPESDEGGFSFTGGGIQPVSFDHIEAVSPVNVGASGGIVNITATNADNDITIVGIDADSLTVSIDGGPAIQYDGVTVLNVDALAGDDDISVTVGPLAITAINITGGDPTTGDKLLINGTAAADNVTFTPLSASSGSLTGLNTPVNFNTTEQVIYNGQGGGDALTVIGTLGDDTTEVIPTLGTGSFSAALSPQFNFISVPNTLVNGGGGGFDVVVIHGTAGPDTVTAAAAAITVNGAGTVTIGTNMDRADIHTGDGNDNITLTLFTALPTHIFAGDGDDIVVGSPQDDVIYGGAGNDILVGGAGSDRLYGEEGNDIFGSLTLTADGIAEDPGVDFNFGGPGFDIFFWEPGDGADVNSGGDDGGDVFLFFGNSSANTFVLRAGSTPTHLEAVFGAVVIDNHGIENVVLSALGGADTITVQDLYATEVVSIDLDLGAADSALDSVTVEGRSVADNIMATLVNGQIRIAGLRYNVNVTSAAPADALAINGNDGDDTITVGAGVEAAIHTTIRGNGGNDTLISLASQGGRGVTFDGGADNDTIIGGAGDDIVDGGPGDDTYTGNGGTDNVGGGFNNSVGDTILVPGTAGDDTFVLTLNASGHLLVTINGVTTTYRNFVGGPIADSGIEQILVTGLAGNDTLTVDSSNGAIPIAINFDGGENADLLVLTGGTAASDIYTVGPNPGQGTSQIVIGSVLQTVRFSNLEPVLDLVAGPLVVNATAADNAINYGQGSVAANGLVTIDNFESIEFSNKTTLTLNGLAGSDTFNISPAAPTGLTAVQINGGDPLADGDRVVISGLVGVDTINVAPDAFDSAVVTVNAFPPIDLSTVEHLTINGQRGDDTLIITTPTGRDHIVHTPGANATQGSIAIRRDGGQPLLPISYVVLEVGSVLRFSDAGGGRADHLHFEGTSSDDRFDFLNTNTIRLLGPAAFGNALRTPNTNLPGIQEIRLMGLDGADTFNVPGNHPFEDLVVEGGGPDTGDVLNFNGTGPAVTVNLQLSTIAQAGAGPVTFTGIEVLNAAAGTGAITILGRTTAETITVTPTDATTARIEPSALNLTINTTNTGDLIIDAAGGSDTVAVVGTQAGELITVNSTLVNVAGLKIVNYTNTENLQVFAEAGSDTIDVTPSATTTIFVDGGDPIGSTAGDRIVLHPAGVFVIEPGPENDEGGLVSAGAQRVSWDHIEAITVGPPGPGGPFPGLILGTNGDDDITIIARDGSTHAGADGVQDFTVSVNGGPDILFLDTPMLLVDALAGDDDIVVRQPAPNGAVWNVQIYVAAGTPAAPTGDQGDVLELETPGTQTVVYSPNPATIAVPALPAGVSLAPTTGGIDTATLSDTTNTSSIHVAPFRLTVDVAGVTIFDYVSSPGGVEEVVYQGLAGDDTLTINGTSADDTFTVNPNNEGSGSHESDQAPSFRYSGATAVTVNGGSGGFDQVTIVGTEGPDTVTSTATTSALPAAEQRRWVLESTVLNCLRSPATTTSIWT